ncbi:hypothetical protein BpHYR1_018621 [Brachionus plicatilis]|uniref:Transmembrane protein n=1 Tax=Brachionus plicatilis TaxID=10195 RepID=A0A3M7SK33_BRAPC|nr:hypothetical protein BpHYR1_018621 [Brachionus plicatilis]
MKKLMKTKKIFNLFKRIIKINNLVMSNVRDPSKKKQYGHKLLEILFTLIILFISKCAFISKKHIDQQFFLVFIILEVLSNQFIQTFECSVSYRITLQRSPVVKTKNSCFVPRTTYHRFHAALTITSYHSEKFILTKILLESNIIFKKPYFLDIKQDVNYLKKKWIQIQKKKDIIFYSRMLNFDMSQKINTFSVENLIDYLKF